MTFLHLVRESSYAFAANSDACNSYHIQQPKVKDKTWQLAKIVPATKELIVDIGFFKDSSRQLDFALC